jgi:hypothetical protein
MKTLSKQRQKDLRSIAVLFDVAILTLKKTEPRSVVVDKMCEDIMTIWNNRYGNVVRVTGK